MQLLVIRHAIAEDRDAFAKTERDDGERPLTSEGVRKMRRGARGLRELVPKIETLVTSPLVRAHQTADILRREYDLERVDTASELEPETPLAKTTAALTRLEGDVVAIVGHEPHLSRLVTYLITGADQSGIELKKGGACLVDFDGHPARAAGTLIWSVAPRILRGLAG
jgi:phosphohistidine phosphatase